MSSSLMAGVLACLRTVGALFLGCCVLLPGMWALHQSVAELEESRCTVGGTIPTYQPGEDGYHEQRRNARLGGI